MEMDINKKLIAFDFETIANREGMPPFDEKTVKTGNLKDPDKIKSKVDDARAQYYSKAGLNPHQNLICCFGWCDEDNSGTVMLETESEASEKFLLIEIKYDGFITFNGLQFDVPVLKLHSLFNKIHPAINIDTRKYQVTNHLDVRAVLSNWDQYAKGDMNYYAGRLLYRQKKEGIDGQAVQDYWDVGLYDDIATYCEDDAQITWELGQLVREYYL